MHEPHEKHLTDNCAYKSAQFARSKIVKKNHFHSEAFPVPFPRLFYSPQMWVLTLWFVAPICAGEAVRVAPGEISTSENEYNYSESADGRLRVFARSDGHFQGSKIYLSNWVDGGWSPPEKIAFSDDRYKDSDPFLTADGRSMIFISDRSVSTPAPKRDLDIWRSDWVDGQWQHPVHLGDAVNSSAEELGPELHGDTLYFNSTRAGGPGNLSIYQSRLQNGVFGTPTPLPSPINSAFVQGDFTISPDGRLALFWSTRPHDGHGTLFASQKSENGWGAATLLPASINLPESNFIYTPWFSHDGKYLYFSAMLKQADGKRVTGDIFRVSTAALSEVLPVQDN